MLRSLVCLRRTAAIARLSLPTPWVPAPPAAPRGHRVGALSSSTRALIGAALPAPPIAWSSVPPAVPRGARQAALQLRTVWATPPSAKIRFSRQQTAAQLRRQTQRERDSTVTNRDIMKHRSMRGKGSAVRLVGLGGKTEVVDFAVALQRGEEAGVDVLLVSARSDPPTCKLVDVGKEKYEKKKSEKLRKETNRARLMRQKVKTVKMKVKIEDGDFQRKVDETRRFLGKGHTVRVVVVLLRFVRGGEQRAEGLLRGVQEAVADVSMPLTAKQQQISVDRAQRHLDFFPLMPEEGQGTTEQKQGQQGRRQRQQQQQQQQQQGRQQGRQQQQGRQRRRPTSKQPGLSGQPQKTTQK